MSYRWRWSISLVAVAIALAGALTALKPQIDRLTRESRRAHYFDRGYGSLATGDLSRAEEQFALSERAAPGQGPAVYMLGVVRFERGDYASARKRFQQSLAAAPRQPHVLNALGACLVMEGRSPEAIPQFRRALEGAPNRDVYQWNLALARADARWKSASGRLRKSPRPRIFGSFRLEYEDVVLSVPHKTSLGRPNSAFFPVGPAVH
ncbi:MAG TPA: tetratricopeptide repeat protein [Armatimonadota bacterium]|jgi:Tfp pilus assembly protein PilF